MKKSMNAGWWIGGSLGIALVTFVVVWWVRLPDAAHQLAQFSTSSVGITSPTDGGIVLFTDPLSVEINAATSKPVDHFELWVDGVLLDTLSGEPLPSEMFIYAVSLPWLPAFPGVHTLIVRASGTGWALESNAVRVNVIDPSVAMSGSEYFPLPGETLGSIAAHFGLPPMLLALSNPQIPGLADPTDPNRPVMIPDLPTPVQEDPPQDPPPGMHEGPSPDPAPPAVSRLRTWFDLNILIKQPTPPAAPTLFRWKEGCDVRWYIRDNSDNELGFFLYRLDPGSSSFTRIGNFGPHSGAEFFEFLDTGLYGTFDYYVSAYNSAGETPSNISHVVFSDPTCGSGGSSAMMVAGISLKPSRAAEKAYCYYSFQEGYWSRYPIDPNAFVYPTSNGYDLTRMLADTILSPGTPLSLECWGWSGADLFSLGTASGTVGATPGTSALGGGGQLMDINIKISSVDWKGFVPVLPPGLLNPGIVRITTPYNLTRTVSMETCANHFESGYTVTSRALCEAALFDHMNILVWDWDPICSGCKPEDYLPASKITGYKIYMSMGDGPWYLAATTTYGPWQTVQFMPQGSPLPETPWRYVVRAYSEPYSSPRSNMHTWVDMGDGLASKVIYADVKTEEVKEIASTCSFPDELPAFGLAPGFNVVGYQHLYSSSCGYEDRYYRSTLNFDLGEVKGHVVYTSLLSYSSFYGVSTVPNQSCAKSMFTVTSPGPDGKSGTSLLKELPTLGSAGMGFTVDMTSLVDGWSRAYKPNLGLQMVGRNETLPKTDNSSCWTRYSGFTLIVNYFK
jgi:hypothetical protein